MSDGADMRAYIGVDELIDKIRKYHPDDDMDLVRRAYAFAEQAHANQFRKSGDPYFCHPCAVAVILSIPLGVFAALKPGGIADGI